ncbi:MAG: PQQ-dependent sugar dehydrogenase [Caulobacteraceae bacterium]|nr:PQQ-dependent sugar dehydrogenase [Caulobacter sp.]
MSARILLGGAAAAGLLAAAAIAAPAAPKGDARRGGELFAQQCAVCHGGNGGVGPNLHGVVGRKAGSEPGFGYSAALSKAGFRWDDGHLDRYLTDPQALVPGTTMPAKVADPGQRRDIIAFLHTYVEQGGAKPGPPPRAQGATAKREGNVVVFGDWRADSPGQRHRITPADLPPPFATASAGNGPKRAPRPAGALPQVPAGMKVIAWAEGLERPRALRTAPNGDVFVAEAGANRVSVLREVGGRVQRTTFADGLDDPFGILFYPAGPNPRWVYLAETNRVRRFPYAPGALKPTGAPQTVVAQIADTTGGHTSRDLAVSPDGKRLFVSVGSASNIAEEMPRKSVAEAQAYDRAHGFGAAWGPEADRADVLSFTPEGGDRKVFATGIRNCVGLTVQPGRGTLWCSTNERDGLGDNLVPDYVTSVREGGYYGWPWWYIGGHEEPRLKGQRPDLAGKAITPDVLIQPHSASLQMAFYDGAMFPEWKGSILAAEHGSWNRALRTGYKLIRIPVGADGRAQGGYEDVMTGFVLDAGHVWGRPVGVTVAKDGAILVSDDSSGTVWRLSK